MRLPDYDLIIYLEIGDPGNLRVQFQSETSLPNFCQFKDQTNKKGI